MSNKVKVTWTNQSVGLTEQTLWRKVNNEAWLQVATLTPTQREYTDTLTRVDLYATQLQYKVVSIYETASGTTLEKESDVMTIQHTPRTPEGLVYRHVDNAFKREPNPIGTIIYDELYLDGKEVLVESVDFLIGQIPYDGGDQTGVADGIRMTMIVANINDLKYATLFTLCGRDGDLVLYAITQINLMDCQINGKIITYTIYRSSGDQFWGTGELSRVLQYPITQITVS